MDTETIKSRAQSAVQQVVAPPFVNVGQEERLLSALGGGALALFGLGRGALPLVVSGGYLVYRGLTGHCHLYERLGVDAVRPDRPRKPRPRKTDVVMEASEDSFPASDPPAWGESGVKG
jgi:uncharacterized membrane protein